MKTPLGAVVPRHASNAVTEALADTRVVLLNGARQSGKSTLVRVITKDHGAEWRNLDNALTRQAALADPTGFVDFPDLLVIDEIALSDGHHHGQTAAPPCRVTWPRD
jgi:predicted AAA+ superfamily ATPase